LVSTYTFSPETVAGCVPIIHMFKRSLFTIIMKKIFLFIILGSLNNLIKYLMNPILIPHSFMIYINL
jgi:hypothetical protein